MGRSKYCTAEAPKAFRELIKDIQARYIIVSYNNMGKKGHSRSNAKISDEEILEILNEKGQVSIKEKNFKYYTSGKRRIENHKERLLLLNVSDIIFIMLLGFLHMTDDNVSDFIIPYNNAKWYEGVNIVNLIKYKEQLLSFRCTKSKTN